MQNVNFYYCQLDGQLQKIQTMLLRKILSTAHFNVIQTRFRTTFLLINYET